MRIGIDKKVNLLIISLFLFLGLLLGSYFVWHDTRVLDSKLDERAMVILHSLRTNSEYMILTRDKEAISQLVKGVLTLKDVVYCRVEDVDGKLLYEDGSQKEEQSVREFTSAVVTKRALEEEDEMIFGSTEEVEEEIGKIHLAISLSGLEREVKHIKRAVAVFILFAIILISLASTLFLKFILSRPVSVLVRGTEKIARGDLDYKVPVKSNDEIGLLAASFNEMTKNLSETLVSKNYIDNIIRSMADSLIVTDADCVIKTVNQATLNLLGYSRDELIGKHIEMLFEKGSFRCEKLAELMKKESYSNKDKCYVAKDGTEIHVLISSSAMYEDDRRIQGLVFFAQDITERRIMEAQLAQAQKMEGIGQLAAGIAHEINTPTQYVGDNTRFLQESFEDILQILQKYGRLLAVTKEGDLMNNGLLSEVETAIREADLEYLAEEIPQAIEQSLEGIGRVSKIVRAMKEFSHPGGEGKKACDLNKAIQNTITVASNEWKYVAGMETDFAPGLNSVPCIESEFNQAILNLIINAAHAITDVVGDCSSAEKGTIYISTRAAGDWAEVRVSDTGTGIPEDVRKRIFDPFFTTKEVGRGTGQGLSIAYSVVVDKHGGTIDLESEVGKGTTFIIRLPVNSLSDNIGTKAAV